MSALRVLIVDDHKIIRDGLRTLIHKEAGMEVIAEAVTGREAVRLAQKLRPSIVIMDVSMPDMNGIDATRKITEEAPGVQVIALSMQSNRRYVLGRLSAIDSAHPACPPGKEKHDERGDLLQITSSASLLPQMR